LEISAVTAGDGPPWIYKIMAEQNKGNSDPSQAIKFGNSF